MPVNTRRAKGTAEVRIDYTVCNTCGLCVEVCKGMPLYLEDGRVKIDQTILFGCIGCGQCAAVCPKMCITVEGRELHPHDLFKLPPKEDRAGYEQFLAMLQNRRSCRTFKDSEVDPELIQKILDTVATAPMGLPPSEVEVLVLDGFAAVREFARDVIEVYQAKKWFFSPWMLTLMRPFMGKEVTDLMKSFAAPLPDFFAGKLAIGQDWLLYGAPLAMYFHAAPTSDPVDFAVTGTYAMLAAESLGLGTCMIGTVGPVMKYKTQLNTKYNIPTDNNHGIMVIFGYPRIKYTRGINRTLARIDYIRRRRS
ncbi:MAG: nitroreductase family protein [Deltaproteobacteria bacterium]